MTQMIKALRATATKWRAGNQEHPGGVVLVWEGEVYGRRTNGAIRKARAQAPTPWTRKGRGSAAQVIPSPALKRWAKPVGEARFRVHKIYEGLLFMGQAKNRGTRDQRISGAKEDHRMVAPGTCQAQPSNVGRTS